MKHYDDPKAFMEYSNDMQDVYKTIEGYNPGIKCKVLIVLKVFNSMIADMINNKKLNPVVTELFIRIRKLIFPLPLLCNLISKCQKMLD